MFIFRPRSGGIKKLLGFLRHPAGSAVLLLFVATLMVLLSRSVLPANHRMLRGFAGYYTASFLLIRGELGPQAYDNAWFIEQVQAVTGQPVSEILAPTLPTVSLMATPFTLWPPRMARTLWTWTNFLALLLTLGLLVNVLYRLDQEKGQPLLWLGLAAFAFVFPPVAANFHEDQAIILFFCLFVVTLWGLTTRREWLAGLTLGLALVLKTTGLSLWLLFLTQRRWPALVWGLATGVGVVLISLPWIGGRTWLAYLQTAATVTGGPLKAITAYQTSAGFFTHLFYFDPTWNPNPLFHWPALAAACSLAATAAALAITLWRGRRAATADFFAALVPLSVILLPIAEEHHFIVLLIPIFMLVSDLRRPPPSTGFFSIDRLLLGAALLLLVAPIPYESFSFRAGWWVIPAYPRLYGGWLIWLVAVRRMAVRGEQQERFPEAPAGRWKDLE